MKKNTVYKCSACSYTQRSWLGRCPECGSWNTMEECVLPANKGGAPSSSREGASVPVFMKDVVLSDDERLSTGITEFDRVLGGGAAKHSAILVGGEPGIGKSTLLLAAAAFFSKQVRTLYVSGEESYNQIKGREERLELKADTLEALCTTSLEDVKDALGSAAPQVVIIDSIQTLFSDDLGQASGSVTQLRYCASELVDWVKTHDAVLFMTAHVTKDGIIAGPKSLEHLVDTVLYFDRNGPQDEVRFLRAQKNRFGSVDELGLFTMEKTGLKCIQDPSTLFVTRRNGNNPSGVACTSVVEGSRVFIVEIQALTVSAKGSINRVYSDKIDSARVSRISAVLEKRLGMQFSDQDIYINVAGGIRLTESAIDAALAAALYSARSDMPIPQGTLILGEVSLAGEVRPITKQRQRIRQGKELGFENIIAPEKDEGAVVAESVKDLVRILFT